MVRVLLQDLRSLKFLSPDGEWTSDSEAALNFGQVVLAADFVFSRHLHHVRVVFHFCADAQSDMALPPVQAYV